MKNIKWFLDEYGKLLNKNMVSRALYVCKYSSEIYVFEIESKICFVFIYNFGELAEISTEKDAMNKYMMLIPGSTCAEYESFVEI